MRDDTNRGVERAAEQAAPSRWRFRIISRASMYRLAGLAVIMAALAVWAYFALMRMPGRSFSGPLPQSTVPQTALSDELKAHVERLAGEIGPRNYIHDLKLEEAALYIEATLAGMGYSVERQVLDPETTEKVECRNLIVEIPGTTNPEEIVVVGGHYDSCGVAPGADDNASAVAGVLALAKRFAGSEPARTLRFVLFVNEEPPFFQKTGMGSLAYATRCQERGEEVVAMLCLEMLGCFKDADGSQTYPIPGLGLVYPTTGDFIAFVGNVASRKLLRRIVASFRQNAAFPSEGAALPGWLPGVGWSDHWSFWKAGYPAVMVTDTAMHRYDHYHQPSDTPDKLDYGRMARVVEGLVPVTAELAAADID